MSTNDFFSGFQVAKPELNVINKAGDHVVRVLSMRMTDADTRLDGIPKGISRQWVDTQQQLAITFGGKSGVITNRFNSKGYIRFDELNDEQRNSGKFFNASGYACIKNKKGELERCEDVGRTTECINIINKFAMAIDIAEGENLIDGVSRAITEKRELIVSVKVDTYDGKDQYVVSGYKKAVDVRVDADDEYSA